MTITEIKIADRFNMDCNTDNPYMMSSCMLWSYDFRRKKIREELSSFQTYQYHYINNMHGQHSKAICKLDRTAYYPKVDLVAHYMEEDIDDRGEDVVTKVYLSSGAEFNNAKNNKIYRTAILRDMKYTEFVFNQAKGCNARIIGVIINTATYDYTVVDEVYDGDIIEDIYECIDAYN